MFSDSFRYAVTMFAAGVGIPILAALNAQLGRGIGSPPAAAIVLFTVALCSVVAVALVTNGITPLRDVAAQPRNLLLGGVFVAFYVLSVTWIAPKFGLGNAIICVLLGQLVSAALIDQFGLMGAMVKPVSLMRAAGLAFMAFGVILAQRG